jgi:flagellar basal body P-ring protein FlgI
MRKKSKGIVIYETIQVYANTNIRDLTEAIQENVKNIVNMTTGVVVVDVNIQVKNVYKGARKQEEEVTQKPQNKVEEPIEEPKEIVAEDTTLVKEVLVPAPELVKEEDEAKEVPEEENK